MCHTVQYRITEMKSPNNSTNRIQISIIKFSSTVTQIINIYIFSIKHVKWYLMIHFVEKINTLIF